MKPRPLVGPGVIAVGSVGLLLFASTDYGDDWRPVAEPIDLSRPGTTVASFRARPDARYSLGVEVDWGPGAECLLGTRRSSSAAACVVDVELDVAWAVRVDGVDVVQGTSADWAGGSWGGGSGLAAMLDNFVARPVESDYEVVVSVLSPAPRLATFSPRLVVGLGGGERHADYAPRVYAHLGGIVGLLIALGATLRVFWIERRSVP